MMVAVLCAARNSIYKGFQDVEVYDIDRDARTFGGGMPVVCHPPCRAWSAFCAHQAKPLPGEKELAPMCVDKLRECGGILEHPAHSRLWKYLGLPKPGEPIKDGLWTIAVQQSWWGDSRTKNTWLLICGIDKVEVPMAPHDANGDRRRWQLMSKHQRAASVPVFATWLVETARKAKVGIAGIC